MTLNMLDAIRKKLNMKLDEPSYQHTGEDFYTGICVAQQILDDVELEFCKENLIYKYAILHAQHLLKYGVDIGEKWETATQNTIALNEAYLRGVKDERDNFDRLREESDDWIPCSEKLPDVDKYSAKTYWVTMHVKDFNNYFTKSMKWNGYLKRWEQSNGKKVSNYWEIVAWKEYITPEPYQPEGD